MSTAMGMLTYAVDRQIVNSGKHSPISVPPSSVLIVRARGGGNLQPFAGSRRAAAVATTGSFFVPSFYRPTANTSYSVGSIRMDVGCKLIVYLPIYRDPRRGSRWGAGAEVRCPIAL
jgi:hypothetical protein